MTDAITAVFSGLRRTRTSALYRYDTNVMLKFEGITLPSVYEVHFSNYDNTGVATTMLGDENGVDIPNELLETGYTIYAWIYLHANPGNGMTKYTVEIPVKARPQPENYEPSGISPWEEVVRTITEIKEDAQDAATLSESWAVGGTDTREGEDTDNAKYYSGVAEDASETATEKASIATEAANSASGSKNTAQDAANTAVAAKNVAVAAQRLAEGYANSADLSKRAAASSEGNALTSAQGAAQSANNASGFASSASGNALKSEGYAVGEQNGMPVASGSPYYYNNSKYYSEQASGSAETATAKAGEASQSASDASDYKTAASEKASEASGSAANAAADALKSEGYALGKQGGADVGSGSPYYQANSKYYKEQAAESASAASGSASNANADALKAEGFAVGTQGGTAVESDSPYYHNNSKYYEEQAAAVAASIPADYSQLSADVSELKSDKADKTGTYSSLTAGNLATEDGSNNNTPYLFRASGGGVRVGEREYDKIVGGTVAHNQIVHNGNFESGTTYWTVNRATISASDGIVTVTKDENTVMGTGYVHQPAVMLTVGHKYLFSCEYKGIAGKQLTLFTNGAGMTNVIPSDSNWHSKAIISNITVLPSVTCLFWLSYETTTVDNVAQFRNIFYIDLTQMFGTTIADYLYTLESGTAGAGVAKLKEWGFFTQPYYPYNAGELKSVEGLSSHEMVGFNQWDGEFENAVLNSDGTVTASPTRKTTKNHVHVIPNTLYCMRLPGNGRGRGAFYDSEKNLVSYFADFPATGTESVFPNNGTIVSTASGYYCLFVTPSTAHWVKYTAPGADIEKTCINLSDPAKNGTYEPYVKHTYPLDDSLTLRGIPKLDSANQLYYDGDTYESDGTVTRRYGIVDLGTLTWTYTAASGNRSMFTSYNLEGLYKPSGSNAIRVNVISQKYNNMPMNSTFASGDFGMDGGVPARRIVVCDNSFTDAESFKTAMSGVYLVYELATSTSETAEPFAAPQIVDKYGTEEYVTTGIVPVGHETLYPENLREKIEGLPWNFASLIAPTEVIYKATQNYTTGSLFIVDNVLYKATANIANGGDITPGTNCQATTLAAVIAAL